MGTKTFFCLFFFALLAPAISLSDEKQEWFEFSLSPRLNPSSPANVGRLVLDAPAGKHGFLRSKNSRFIFEDGSPAKFWGTNLCFSACFPDKKEAELLADRLAFFGFNAVRLHHMDFFFEPRGIFQDIKPLETNPQRKIAARLSALQLDRLDYLIYQLKIRGIYIDINLLVSRHFTAASGVNSAGRLEMAAKPVSLFDPKLIELQKDYAHQLLTHTNPYTGLKYSEEPAVALVEITNENSLFNYWGWNRLDKNPANKNLLPDFYLDQLDLLWNEWLKHKYITVGAAKKALGMDPQNKGAPGFSFERPSHRAIGLSSRNSREDISAFYISVEKNYFDEMSSYLKETAGIKIPITGIGGPPDENDINAESGADFIDSHAYWDHPSFPDGWDLNNFRISGRSMLLDKNSGIAENLGRSKTHDKPCTLTEWSHCYPNPFAYETPVLVAAEALKHEIAAIFQFAFSHDKPTAAKMSSIDNFFDTIANPQQLLLTSTGSYLFQTESAAESSVNEGIFKLRSARVLGASGKLLGRQVDIGALHIKSENDGAFFLYSADGKTIEQSEKLVLVAVGKIKNKDSYWAADGKFKWGASPTLLSCLNAEVSLDRRQPFHIFALDASGSRDVEIHSKLDQHKIKFSISGVNAPWFEINLSS